VRRGPGCGKQRRVLEGWLGGPRGHAHGAGARAAGGHAPWTSFLVVSIFSSTGIENAAVLPVPFLARARMSRPVSAMGIDSSWMGEGFSKPFS
jgi:hypothetical protein